MLALYPLWRKARRVYSLTSRLPGTNRLGFQPSLALSGCWVTILNICCWSGYSPLYWRILVAVCNRR
ncbi:MAG: hypothetical protein ABW170_19275 [Candidatus Thiodiazotropha sp. L084R]